MTLASSELYSISDWGSVHSFDYADFNTPIPWSAYTGMPIMHYTTMTDCADWSSYDFINDYGSQRLGCAETIYDAAYKPLLVVPLQARDLDPEWAECVLDLQGLYDPPKALEAATTIEPASIPTTPATPASSAGHDLPTKTTTGSSNVPTTTGPADGQAPNGSQSAKPGDTPAKGGDTVPASSQENPSPKHSPAGSAPEDDGSSLPTSADPVTIAQTFGPSQVPNDQQNGDPSAETPNSTKMPPASAAAPSSTDGDPQATKVLGQPTTSMDGIETLLSLLDQTLTTKSPAVPSADPASRLLSILGGLESTAGDTVVQSSNLPNNAEQNIHTIDSPPAAPDFIGTVPVSVASDGNAVFGSQTLNPGVETIIDGIPISVGTSVIIVASNGNPDVPVTTIIPQAIPESNEASADGAVGSTVSNSLHAVVVSADGKAFTISPGQAANAIVVNRVTMTVKGPGVAADGYSISAYDGGVAIGTSSINLAPSLFSGVAAVYGDVPGSSEVVTIGNEPLSVSFDPPGRPGVVVVGSQTLIIGGPPATVNGAVVSAGPAGLVVGSSDAPLHSVEGSSYVADLNPASSVVIGTRTIAMVSATGETSDPGFYLGTQLVSIGASAVTINGVSVSAWSAGLVIGGSSHTLLQQTLTTPDSDVYATSVVIGSQTFSVSAASPEASIIYVGSQAITIGGAATTIDGVVVSAYSGGLAVGGSTIVLSAATSTSVNPPMSKGYASVVTVGSQTFTIPEASSGASVVFVGSQQLSLGGQATTINGIRVSAGTAGIVIGSSTIPLPTDGPLASGSKSHGIESPLEQSVSAITASASSGDDGAVSTGVTGAARISSTSSSGVEVVTPGLPSILFALLAATICLAV